MNTPTTYDEALALRSSLIAKVDALSDELSIIGKTDLSKRRKLLQAQRGAQDQLRRVKEWLRVHDPARESEWQLLGRAYRLLERIGGNLGAGISDAASVEDEITALLDAIEMTVPKKHLEAP